jgi:glycosyltransferase involved in cell wall biosynthesis
MHVSQLAERLRNNGHDISVVATPDSPLDTSLKKMAFKPEGQELNGYFNPGAALNLIKLLRKKEVQLVHAHYSKDLWTLVPALHFANKVPLVLTKHVGTSKSKKDPLHTWLYSKVNYFIAVSQVIYNNLLETHPINKNKIGIVYPGIDLRRFDPNRYNPTQVKLEIGWHPETQVVGIVGRIQIGKGYLEFLEMAKRLSMKLPNVRFLIVGGPSMGETQEAELILQKIWDDGLDKKVFHAGFQENVAKFLSCMDIFVFPSRAESFGLALTEAMAMKKPVVACNCDGVLDVVVDNKTGSLVPPQNVDKLERAVLELLQNSNLRIYYGQEGRKRAEKLFDIRMMVSKIEALYQSVSPVTNNVKLGLNLTHV